MSKKQSHTGHRSSISGQFVKEKYAKAHTSTTQKESIPNPGKGDTGRSGKSHTGHRSSISGQFVKEKYAKAHTSTTQKESIPNPGKGDTGRSGRSGEK